VAAPSQSSHVAQSAHSPATIPPPTTYAVSAGLMFGMIAFGPGLLKERLASSRDSFMFLYEYHSPVAGKDNVENSSGFVEVEEQGKGSVIDGFWGGVLNEKELDPCSRVTRVYSKRFENPKITCLFMVSSPADYRI